MRGLLLMSVGLILGMAPVAAPLDATAKEIKGVHSSIEIDAPPSVVWEAVADQRKTDPDIEYSKVLSRTGNVVVVEQKFGKLPMLGSAVVTFRSDEVPHKRIDYKMLKSDKFKHMSGSWILTPIDKDTTKLELTNFVDAGVPMSQFIVNQVTKGKVKARLSNVKLIAESAQRKIAARDKSEVN